MTTLHKAAEGVLRVIDDIVGNLVAVPDEATQAIATLRHALAQQGEQQEPDTWTDDGGWTFPVERQIIQTQITKDISTAQPDWSLLEATQESLREHMAMVKELQAKLAQQGEPVAKDLMWATVAMQERHDQRIENTVATLEKIKQEQAARYQPVKEAFWWRVRIGDGAQTIGRCYTETEAQRLAAELQRAFNDGAFCVEKVVCSGDLIGAAAPAARQGADK